MLIVYILCKLLIIQITALVLHFIPIVLSAHTKNHNKGSSHLTIYSFERNKKKILLFFLHIAQYDDVHSLVRMIEYGNR